MKFRVKFSHHNECYQRWPTPGQCKTWPQCISHWRPFKTGLCSMAQLWCGMHRGGPNLGDERRLFAWSMPRRLSQSEMWYPQVGQLLAPRAIESRHRNVESYGSRPKSDQDRGRRRSNPYIHPVASEKMNSLEHKEDQMGATSL